MKLFPYKMMFWSTLFKSQINNIYKTLYITCLILYNTSFTLSNWQIQRYRTARYSTVRYRISLIYVQYAIGNGMHKKDSVMDIIITPAIKQSCLTHASKGSDYVIRDAESVKFRKDARSSCPVQSSSTRRPIPLALNHLGLRGGHFQAMLKEFAMILVTMLGGCSLLQGPFALSINGALHKTLNTWGSHLTWTAQRGHAA